jgi:hypothetical protein
VRIVRPSQTGVMAESGSIAAPWMCSRSTSPARRSCLAVPSHGGCAFNRHAAHAMLCTRGIKRLVLRVELLSAERGAEWAHHLSDSRVSPRQEYDMKIGDPLASGGSASKGVGHADRVRAIDAVFAGIA